MHANFIVAAAIIYAIVSAPLSLAQAETPREPQVLTAAEITELMTNSWIAGEWLGQAYTQVFLTIDPDKGYGLTEYIAGGPSVGRWRVDSASDHPQWSVRLEPESGLYCSQWPPGTTWDCYAITQAPGEDQDQEQDQDDQPRYQWLDLHLDQPQPFTVTSSF